MNLFQLKNIITFICVSFVMIIFFNETQAGCQDASVKVETRRFGFGKAVLKGIQKAKQVKTKINGIKKKTREIKRQVKRAAAAARQKVRKAAREAAKKAAEATRKAAKRAAVAAKKVARETAAKAAKAAGKAAREAKWAAEKVVKESAKISENLVKAANNVAGDIATGVRQEIVNAIVDKIADNILPASDYDNYDTSIETTTESQEEVTTPPIVIQIYVGKNATEEVLEASPENTNEVVEEVLRRSHRNHQKLCNCRAHKKQKHHQGS